MTREEFDKWRKNMNILQYVQSACGIVVITCSALVVASFGQKLLERTHELEGQVRELQETVHELRVNVELDRATIKGMRGGW